MILRNLCIACTAAVVWICVFGFPYATRNDRVADAPAPQRYLQALRRGFSSPNAVKRFVGASEWKSKMAPFFGDAIYAKLTKQPQIMMFQSALAGPLAGLFATDPTFVDNGADPFIVKRAPREFYLFYSQGKQIVVRQSTDAASWSPKQLTDLGEPSSMRDPSYPSIAHQAGRFYMAGRAKPAAGQPRGSLAIWRATSFPLKWEKFSTVDPDPLADAMQPTLLVYGGRLWLLNTRRLQTPQGQHRLGLYSGQPVLDLYHALEAKGPWTKHPSSPIAAGAGSALSAGAPLQLAQQPAEPALYRLVQDCRLHYLQAVRARRVTALSVHTYQEEAEEEEEEEEKQAEGGAGEKGGEEDNAAVIGASGAGWNALGSHALAATQTEDGAWVGFADGFAAPAEWEPGSETAGRYRGST
jgi:hypothetical protein